MRAQQRFEVFLNLAVEMEMPSLAVALLCIRGAGVYAAIGPIWAMLTEIIPPASTGVGIGLINGLANLRIMESSTEWGYKRLR